MKALSVVWESIRERNYRLKKKNFLSGPTNEWYQGVRAVSTEEEEEETSHTMLKMENNLIRERRGTSGSSSNASLDGRTASPTHLA